MTTRLLVIDDDSSLRFPLVSALRKLPDVRVSDVDSFDQALGARLPEVSAIICPLDLVKGSALELLSSFDAAGRFIPTVLLLGSAVPVPRLPCVRLVQQGAPMQRLRDTVAELLDEQAARPSLLTPREAVGLSMVGRHASAVSIRGRQVSGVIEVWGGHARFASDAAGVGDAALERLLSQGETARVSALRAGAHPSNITSHPTALALLSPPQPAFVPPPQPSSVAPLPVPESDDPAFVTHWNTAVDALLRRDYAAARGSLEAARALRPDDPRVLANLTRLDEIAARRLGSPKMATADPSLSRAASRVLVADDNAFARRVLSHALWRSGFEVVTASNGDEAWALLQRPDRPGILLLDWMMPGVDGLELCRRVRERTDMQPAYIVLVTARGRHEDVLLGLDAGADDFVTKPYVYEELVARVRLGQRLLSGAPSPRSLLAPAIAEARSADGGVLVVRSGNDTGRIFFSRGQVAWAAVSGQKSSLRALLEGQVHIAPEDLRAALEDCAKSGRGLLATLEDWKLADAKVVREILRAHVAATIEKIFALAEDSVLFVPEARPFSGDVSFSFDEVFPADFLSYEAVSSVPPHAPGERLNAPDIALDPFYASVDGALSLCVFDGGSGECIARAGDAPDMDVVRAMLRLSHSLGEGPSRELSAADERTFHMMHGLGPSVDDRHLYVAATKPGTSLAMLRLQVSQIAAALAEQGEG